MKKKIIGMLSVCAMALTLFAVNKMTTIVNAEENGQVVYVSTNGVDSNIGTISAPFQTLEKALKEVVDGGVIVLQDTVTIDTWEKHNKEVSITGGTLQMTWSNDIVINDSVNFYNTNLLVNTATNVYANGNSVTIGENVVWTGSPTLELHGGGMAGTTVVSTDLTVLSGTYKSIFGGSKSGTVLGDTNLFVGGTVNSDVDETDHAIDCFVFGGGNGDTIKGSTNVTFGGNAKVVYLFGGSNNANASIANGSNLNVTGGKGMSAYAGNRNVDAKSGANAVITGGMFEQVFGGNERASMTGDVDMRVMGGTITRRVYGGCYNDTSGRSFSTSYGVSGEICLTIGDVSIDFSSSESDRSIYARSRYNKDIENTQLVFSNETAYNSYKNKLAAQDSTMKLFMGSLSAADELHCYTYTLNNNVITQTCKYHDTHSATASLSLEENLVEVYNGAALEPASLEYSENWEYDKPEVEYQNNEKGGVATCSVSIGDQTIEGTFTIIEAPTILGGSVRLSTPAGLRFQSKVSDGMVEMGTTFGTLIIPRAVLGEEELTIETAMVENIEQTQWATEIVKENNPSAYEEGYEYFNAVLTDIPAEHYGTEIVARSYVYLDGVYYYSDEVERSIAQVAAYAIQDGYTDSVLYTYVDTALANEVKTLEREVILGENSIYRLTLSGVKNYVAVWSVNDDSVLTIDKNGKITARQPGVACVTAQIGTTVLYCEVIIREDIEDNTNELPLIPYD